MAAIVWSDFPTIHFSSSQTGHMGRPGSPSSSLNDMGG